MKCECLRWSFIGFSSESVFSFCYKFISWAAHNQANCRQGLLSFWVVLLGMVREWVLYSFSLQKIIPSSITFILLVLYSCVVFEAEKSKVLTNKYTFFECKRG